MCEGIEEESRSDNYQNGEYCQRCTGAGGGAAYPWQHGELLNVEVATDRFDLRQFFRAMMAHE
jgi:hypothetical protein